MVAKVPTRVPVPDPAGRAADHSLVVIDVEIESPERATDIRPRMLWYYEFLRRRYSLPVLPICLFLRVGLNGLGWDAYEERLWDHLLLRFEYAYIGLPALDGLPYYNGPNLLGLALSALMKLPADDRARIKAEGLAKIAGARENTARRELLAECFNNYVKLDPSEAPEFDRLLSEQAPEVKSMVSSFEISGRLKERRDLVRKMLDKKFGPLPQVVLDRLGILTAERLEEIALSLLDGATLKDLGLTDE